MERFKHATISDTIVIKSMAWLSPVQINRDMMMRRKFTLTLSLVVGKLGKLDVLA